MHIKFRTFKILYTTSEFTFLNSASKGKRFYIFAISYIYHLITILHTSCLPIIAVAYKQLPLIGFFFIRLGYIAVNLD